MHWSSLLAILLLMLAALYGRAEAQQTKTIVGANWELPGFDARNTNFNPQTQINSENVADVELKWIYQVPAKPAGTKNAVPPEGIQTTPLVINGVVYFATGYNRLIALEGSSGRELWSFQANISSYFSKPWWSGRLATRSLTLHNGISTCKAMTAPSMDSSLLVESSYFTCPIHAKTYRAILVSTSESWLLSFTMIF